MPSISLNRTSGAAESPANILDGLKFSLLTVPSLITMYGSCSLETTVVDMSVDSQDFLKAGAVNLEAASGVLDTDRDLIVSRELVPAGQLFLSPVILAAAGSRFLVVIEPVA